MAVLLYDLETAGVNALNSDLGAVVCIGYKFLGDKRAKVLRIDQFPGWYSRKRGLNDKPLLRAFSKVVERADLLVAHYGDQFDRRFLNGRMAIAGLPPLPSSLKQRDTRYLAWKHMRFSSNRLGRLAEVFGLPVRKAEKEWPDWWNRALAGDRTAIREMAKYCAQDVEVLEQIYLRLRPFDAAHPRVHPGEVCRVCGSNRLHRRGVSVSLNQRFYRFQCQVCGAWSRSSKSLPDWRGDTR